MRFRSYFLELVNGKNDLDSDAAYITCSTISRHLFYFPTQSSLVEQWHKATLRM